MSSFYDKIKQTTSEAKSQRFQTQSIFLEKLIENAAKDGKTSVCTSMEIDYDVRMHFVNQGFTMYRKPEPLDYFEISWA